MNPKPNDFTDDSSSTLGLSHSGTYLGPRPSSVRASGGIEAHFAGDVERIRKVVRERIEKRARELAKQGISWTQARKLAAEEVENPEKTRELKDREGDKVRAIENLMGAHDKPSSHSSSSSKSKFKSEKRGTKVCRECHLERCTCASTDCSESALVPYLCPLHDVPFGCGCPDRPTKAKGPLPRPQRSNHCRSCGLPRVSCRCYTGRGSFVGARVSGQAKAQIKGADSSAGEILESVADLARTAGVSVDEVKRIIDATKADPTRIASLFGRAQAAASAGAA